MKPHPDNLEYEFDLAPPQAASMVESLRAFGYDLPTALADLVDNSITAKASNIWVDFRWNGESSVISVTDDGIGMTESQLVSAMRPGSQNPLQKRDSQDLGRFGLGLKTASFSQCRHLTVASRQAGNALSTRRWDLDHIAKVNDWQLLRHAGPDSDKYFDRLKKLASGTTVLWEAVDRVVAGQDVGDAHAQDLFLQGAKSVELHLGMVFHRFMSELPRITLHVNDQPVQAWSPFLEAEPATQALTATRLSYQACTIDVKPFVLPHQSKISKSVHEFAAGPRGWNAHQGFYVYRNRRLLVAGDWLGLGWAKEEHYKLARIRVDLPNALDHAWQIDVTKSRATPPPALRSEFRRIGERTRHDAKQIYGHRGARLTPQAAVDRVLLWEPMARHDKVFYRLNRKHPMVVDALKASNDVVATGALLRLIEETVPVPHITITNTERPNSLAGPFETSNDAQIKAVMDQAYTSLLGAGYDPSSAISCLRTIWPFELFPALLASLHETTANDGTS